MCFTFERRHGRAGVERTPIEDMPCIGVVEGELEFLDMISRYIMRMVSWNSIP